MEFDFKLMEIKIDVKATNIFSFDSFSSFEIEHKKKKKRFFF